MNESTDGLGVDVNGRLTEQITTGSQTIVLHHDDIPESDITTVGGLRCTTAVRTVIDIAAELRPAELKTVMEDCLDRGLFTVDEMRSRLSQPDMALRNGARLVRKLIDGRHGSRTSIDLT